MATTFPCPANNSADPGCLSPPFPTAPATALTPATGHGVARASNTASTPAPLPSTVPALQAPSLPLGRSAVSGLGD
uniref:Uncharacterized protein n=1 Tax=Leersia perrieri TaxID=77586 RepID=A0A0D9XHZ4_9ORYZ